MAQTELLHEAVRFVEFLLSRPVAARIAKVLVVGSAVKGGATADSDVDVLVVTTIGEPVGIEIDEALLDFHGQSAAPLEVVTCVPSEILPPTDYFLTNVLRYGKEIYSIPQDEIKRAAARELAALAREYLDASGEALERGRHCLATDGGYNAAELAAKGLILLKVDDLPGSHGGIA